VPKQFHFIEELYEQPHAVRRSLEHADNMLREMAQSYAGRIKRVILTGCGDPYMLAIAAAYAFEQWAGIPAEAVEAAELSLYRNSRLITPDTLVILITSSGKTVKVIDAARLAAAHGATRFALTNRVPSPITSETDQVVQTQSGWSDSFPTKQTTCALAVLYDLALHWAAASDSLPSTQVATLRKELFESMPAAMEQALNLEAAVEQLAKENVSAPFYAFVGSGPNLTTALLGAAKMKETSQSRAEGSNLEEYGHLHGLSLVDGDPVFIVTAPGRIGERNRLICRWISANGGKPFIVGPGLEKEKWADLNVAYLEVPDHSESFGPLVAVLPLQMFAYHIALGKERNPDRPPERGGMGYLQTIIYTSVLEGWENR
jgi:glucosamine--fructose-6-phosphate aminotransferase (isomerizing)